LNLHFIEINLIIELTASLN